jgi:hypothetical protein
MRTVLRVCACLRTAMTPSPCRIRTCALQGLPKCRLFVFQYLSFSVAYQSMICPSCVMDLSFDIFRVVCFLLGNSSASEFYMPTFRNTLFHLLADEDGTDCSETSAYKIRPPGNYPEESTLHSERGESLKSRIFSFTYVFRRSRCRWNLTEAGCKCMESIEVAQKRSLMNAMEHIIFLRSWWLLK